MRSVTSPQSSSQVWGVIILVLCAFGLLDAGYLTLNHFQNTVPPCSIGSFNDCGQVLRSSYSVIFGIPLSLFGVIHYVALFAFIFFAFLTRKILFKALVVIEGVIGALASLYFVYVQLAILHSICIYCMASAIISFLILILIFYLYAYDFRKIIFYKLRILYKLFGKPLFFLLDPEFVHNNAMYLGNIFSRIPGIKTLFRLIFTFKDPSLVQKVGGIKYDNPVGLAAGYDYTASLTGILPSIGFGFETVGTITNMPCAGNDKPRLGRLPKSRSLMVNKGFRNPGASKIIERLSRESFAFPIGISIGTTNSTKITSLEMAIEDVKKTFQMFEKSDVNVSYYELNISCPNLKVDISFYESSNLDKLLNELSKLKIKKPIYVKMPINHTDREVKKMLDTTLKYKFITGVIFGNLQKDRNDPSFNAGELARWDKGNFSGMPTQKRSDELIKLAYKYVGKKLVIIGCGGIFSARDAYRKIKYGASLVQMITGMIFEGPQVIGEINMGICELLHKDGYSSIREAIGSGSSSK